MAWTGTSKCPGTRYIDMHTIASFHAYFVLWTYVHMRERRDVYIADYIINVITALRLFAPRDEPPRELANISTGDNLEYWRQNMRVCACAYAPAAIFWISCLRTTIKWCSQWRLCGTTITARIITWRSCVPLWIELNRSSMKQCYAACYIEKDRIVI